MDATLRPRVSRGFWIFSRQDAKGAKVIQPPASRLVIYWMAHVPGTIPSTPMVGLSRQKQHPRLFNTLPYLRIGVLRHGGHAGL